MKKSYFTVIGFFVAPVICAGIFAVSSPLLSVIDMFIISYYYSVLATVLIGIPSFLLVRHFWRITWLSALSVGFVDGMFVDIILFSNSTLSSLATFGMSGAISAFVFWLIWKRGNPSKEE